MVSGDKLSSWGDEDEIRAALARKGRITEEETWGPRVPRLQTTTNLALVAEVGVASEPEAEDPSPIEEAA